MMLHLKEPDQHSPKEDSEVKTLNQIKVIKIIKIIKELPIPEMPKVISVVLTFKEDSMVKNKVETVETNKHGLEFKNLEEEHFKLPLPLLHAESNDLRKNLSFFKNIFKTQLSFC